MEPTLSSLSTKQPWWRTDLYTGQEGLPSAFENLSGPQGVALVKAWPDGRTQPGWGMQPAADHPDRHFMPCYTGGEFNSRRVLYGFAQGRWNFAIVMRSVQMICVDIDGKNGGLEHAKRLGMLPPTLAETSKSGDGFHLFYLVDDQWDTDAGFDGYADHIGIEQGVDIRSVGCVFHHEQQRWNHRDPVAIPQHLRDLMQAKKQRQASNQQRVAKVIQSGDEMEMLMLHDELETDLKKPIPTGKRNITLFAIGQKMKDAGVPDWDVKIEARADQLGLDDAETEKLVRNIRTYN